MWSFEIVLLLKSQAGRWTHDDIVSALRGSDLIVSQSIENLTMAGLVDVDAEGRIGYTPVNTSTAELMDRAQRLYESRADHVRRLIVSQNVSSLRAFANAFRLRDE
ncbi:hypothetical protein [Sphingomonas parva]|uniref:hypothetical protein n=1 Tax=Sphingomonas parva TaxID=2555898 RepID=UPI001CDBB20F|nr:hypothetical protein [Sphingomonas parva]